MMFEAHELGPQLIRIILISWPDKLLLDLSAYILNFQSETLHQAPENVEPILSWESNDWLHVIFFIVVLDYSIHMFEFDCFFVLSIWTLVNDKAFLFFGPDDQFALAIATDIWEEHELCFREGGLLEALDEGWFLHVM